MAVARPQARITTGLVPLRNDSGKERRNECLDNWSGSGRAKRPVSGFVGGTSLDELAGPHCRGSVLGHLGERSRDTCLAAGTGVGQRVVDPYVTSHHSISVVGGSAAWPDRLVPRALLAAEADRPFTSSSEDVRRGPGFLLPAPCTSVAWGHCWRPDLVAVEY